MDLRKLKTLIDLVSESNVSELEITEAEGKVRIVKGGVPIVQHYAPLPANPVMAPVPATASIAASAPAPSAPAAAPETVGQVHHGWAQSFRRSAVFMRGTQPETVEL